jgi:hypothetical protein
MAKLDVNMLFDAICDVVLHEHSTKEVLREIDTRTGAQGGGDIMKIISFVQDERKNRGLYALDFAIKPKDLKLGWSEWNSGGGCMIWSCDLTDCTSIHLTDESCILVDIPTEPYWKLDWDSNTEGADVQVNHTLAECDMNDIAQGRNIDFLFCPWLGQEIADLVKSDVDKICEIF